MKIGILANRSAGSAASLGSVMDKIKGAWGAHRLIGVSEYGGDFLEDPAPAPPRLPYVARLEAALSAIAEKEPDFILCLGGDGTAAYAAEYLLKNQLDIPLSGLGLGTANVGPIVHLKADDIPPAESLAVRKLGAVRATDMQGRHIAYGFNDLVLGNTFLGTAQGRTRTFSAGSMIKEGMLKEEEPLKALSEKEAVFSLNGKRLTPPPFKPAQLAASPLEETKQFYGRAVTGLLCYTPGAPLQGAVYLASHPLISAEESEEGFSEWMAGAQILLPQGSELSIENLSPDICVIADGNPYGIPGGSVKIQYIPELLRVL